MLSVGKQVRVMMKEYEEKVGKWHCCKELEVSVLFSLLRNCN